MMVIMSTLTTFFILGLFMPSSGGQPAILAFAALFGVTSGAGVGLAPVLIASVSPIQDIGVRTGTIFSIAALAALTAAPLVGRLRSEVMATKVYHFIRGSMLCHRIGFISSCSVNEKRILARKV